MSQDLSGRKDRLRQEMKRVLLGISAELRASEAARARALLPASCYWQEARSILSYVPFARGEFDVGPLNQAAQDEGKRLLLPRTRGSSISMIPLSNTADWHDGLVPSSFKGLLEPAGDLSPCLPEDIEGPLLILLPGLAFDRKLSRLGRGLGCYDRLLARLFNCAAPLVFHTIGMAFDVQLVEEVPVAETDVCLDALYCGGSILNP